MSGLTHIFESKTLKSNISKSISSTDNINFTISASSDDCYYNLYESFLTLELEVTASADIDKIGGIKTKHQPSGLITNSQCTYVYLKNGELMTVTLNSENEYLGANRAVVSQVFTPKRLHNIAEGYTEFSYNTGTGDDVPVFKNELKLEIINSSNKKVFKGILNIPFRDVLEGANTNTFINLKTLDVTLKTLDRDDFFESAAGKCFVDSDGKGVDTIQLSDVKIKTIKITNHVWKGSDPSLDESLTSLSNTTIRCVNYTLAGDSITNRSFTENPIVPFACKYILMFVTAGDYFTKYRNLKLNYMKVGVFGGASNIGTNFDNSKDITDPRFFDLINYCANTGREESLINYQTWNQKFHIVVLPAGELFSQKANNVFNIDLKWHVDSGIETNDKLRVIFIKDSEASELE